MSTEKYTPETGENVRAQHAETLHNSPETVSLPIENTFKSPALSNHPVKNYTNDGEALSIEGLTASAGPSRENFLLVTIAAVIGSEFGREITYTAALGFLVGYFTTGIIGAGVGLGALALIHIVGWVKNKIRENSY